MSPRLSLEKRIEIVLLYAKFENFEEVRRQFQKRFNSKPPSFSAIRDLVKKFKETGSVHDKIRPGRNRTVVTQQAVQTVSETLSENQNLSVRMGALKIGMKPSSYYKAVLESGLRAFRPTQVVDLSEDDFDRREQFCEMLLARFDENPHLVDKIIWSDESLFKLNGVINRHNSCYWATSNPNIVLPVPDLREGLMVWCGVTSAGLIGPYFFDGTATAARYLDMLRDFVWPRVKHKGLSFQQDGAPPHYSVAVRNWLNEKFPDRWIGRRGPIEWPARSPDLSPPDFFLWGYLKNIVYKDRPTTLDVLRERITQACAEIPIEICQKVCRSVSKRLEECRAQGGRQQL
jgi:transposase